MPELLPRDMPGFTGRDDELARLAGLAGAERTVVSAIGGPAGVGKTALAVRAAHRLLPQFPDGHLYADLRGYTEGQDPAEPGEVLQVFLRRLGVPAGEVPAEVEERSGLLRQMLADRRVLMVLDNARTEAQVRPLLPGAGGSLVLVTSRSVLPGLEADERVSLDVLAEDEAVAMIAGVVGADRAKAEPQAVVEVARLCGRLPLALRIAGQLLAVHPSWPVARLVGMLSGEQDRLARLRVGDLQVRAAFEVSYRQLAQEDARLFRLLGLHPGPDFDVASVAALAGTEPEAAESVLERLVEAYLVVEDNWGQFGMHDLVRLYARKMCQETDSPADRDAAENRVIDYYVMLVGFLNTCLNPGLHPEVEQGAEQAGVRLVSMREALGQFHAERRCLLAALGLAAQRGWDEQVAQLSANLQEALTVLRYLDDLLTAAEAAVTAARHAGDAPAEALALGNLGEAYQRLERFEEAIDCYQQALTIFGETGDRRGEGMALGSLGGAYAGMRRFEEAIDCYQQALAISRETGDRYGKGRTLTNLGIVYRNLRRTEEAVSVHQDAAAIFRETGDRRAEGMALGNLGVAYAEMRRFEEAIDCYQQVLAIFRETGDYHGAGMALDNLALTYEEMQQLDRAAACWSEAAVVMHHVGEHEVARQLKRLAANARPPHRWSLRRRSQS
jgi:tetratricopeptide (TPR) repeat protein